MNESIGVSTVLPPVAAALLVSAADHARTLPVGSLQRAKIIATAKLIDELKLYRLSLGLPPLPRFNEDRPAILAVVRMIS